MFWTWQKKRVATLSGFFRELVTSLPKEVTMVGIMKNLSGLEKLTTRFLIPMLNRKSLIIGIRNDKIELF